MEKTRNYLCYITKTLKLKKQRKMKTEKNERPMTAAAAPYMMIFSAQYVVISVVFRVLQYVKMMISSEQCSV